MHIKKQIIGLAVMALLITGCVFWAKKAEAGRYSLLYHSAGELHVQTGQDKRIRTKAVSYLDGTKFSYSFYFESLTGGSIPVDAGPEPMLRSASLLKLPSVMDLYYLAEVRGIDLDQEVVIQPEWINDQYGSLWMKGAGSKITLREAARLALVDSDNTAINVVKYFVVQNYNGQSTLKKLGLKFMVDNNNKAYTSAQNYSAILRCLYQSCFLSKEDSQSVLEQLALTNFPGISGGVPSDLAVAHKNGETKTSYADCGIVYRPGHPYILCVMVGASPDKAVPVIAKVSGLVYDEIDSLMNAGEASPQRF